MPRPSRNLAALRTRCTPSSGRHQEIAGIKQWQRYTSAVVAGTDGCQALSEPVGMCWEHTSNSKLPGGCRPERLFSHAPLR